MSAGNQRAAPQPRPAAAQPDGEWESIGDVVDAPKPKRNAVLLVAVVVVVLAIGGGAFAIIQSSSGRGGGDVAQTEALAAKRRAEVQAVLGKVDAIIARAQATDDSEAFGDVLTLTLSQGDVAAPRTAGTYKRGNTLLIEAATLQLRPQDAKLMTMMRGIAEGKPSDQRYSYVSTDDLDASIDAFKGVTYVMVVDAYYRPANVSASAFLPGTYRAVLLVYRLDSGEFVSGRVINTSNSSTVRYSAAEAAAAASASGAVADDLRRNAMRDLSAAFAKAAARSIAPPSDPNEPLWKSLGRARVRVRTLDWQDQPIDVPTFGRAGSTEPRDSDRPTVGERVFECEPGLEAWKFSAVFQDTANYEDRLVLEETVRLVARQEIEITLGGSRKLALVRVRILDGSGEIVDGEMHLHKNDGSRSSSGWFDSGSCEQTFLWTPGDVRMRARWGFKVDNRWCNHNWTATKRIEAGRENVIDFGGRDGMSRLEFSVKDAFGNPGDSEVTLYAYDGPRELQQWSMRVSDGATIDWPAGVVRLTASYLDDRAIMLDLAGYRLDGGSVTIEIGGKKQLGRLTVVVLNSAGDPVNAHMTFDTPADIPRPSYASGAQPGSFDLPPCLLRVAARHEGKYTSREVEVVAGRETRLELRLPE